MAASASTVIFPWRPDGLVLVPGASPNTFVTYQGVGGPAGPQGPPGAAGGVASVDGSTGAVSLAGTYAAINSVHQVFTPEAYGATGVVGHDDGPAFTAAYTAANALMVIEGTLTSAEIVCQVGRTYNIATSIIVQPNVTMNMTGATLKGGIAAYPMIAVGSSPTVPAGTDAVGQTGGACFTDSGGASTLIGLKFVGGDVQLFRYGMCSQTFAWSHPIFQDVFFENCNVGFFAYQGLQNPRMLNCTSGGGASGTTLVAAATCFAAGNPYQGGDNFFADGIFIQNLGRQRDSSKDNATFDTWFKAAVLRPTTPSVTIGGSNTFGFTTDQTDTRVTGRNIYVPDRNHRGIYSFTARDLISESCSQGTLLVGNAEFIDVQNISGEGMFGGGPVSSMVKVLLNTGAGVPYVGRFGNINGTLVTGTAKAGVEISHPSGLAAQYVAEAVTGGILGTENFVTNAIGQMSMVKVGYWSNPSISGAVTTFTPTNGVRYCVPFNPQIDCKVSQLGWEVTAGAGVTLDFRIYDSDPTFGTPRNNVAGATSATSAVGWQTTPVPAQPTLAAGSQYWLTVNCNGGAGATFRSINAVIPEAVTTGVALVTTGGYRISTPNANVSPWDITAESNPNADGIPWIRVLAM